MTEEGNVRLYIEGSSVIALESFTPEEAAKLHDALIPAVKQPYEIHPRHRPCSRFASCVLPPV